MDVTLFESLRYFALTTSSLIPQPIPSFGHLEKEIIPKPLQVYTKHSKDVVFTSLSTNPKSTVADHDPSAY